MDMAGIMRNISLATKMTVLLLGGAILVLSFIIGDMYLTSRNALIVEARSNAQNLASAVAHKIEKEFKAMTKVPESMASYLETDFWEKDVILPLLRRMVGRNGEVYGSAVAFEPYAFDPRIRFFSPYFHKSQEGLKFVQLGDQSYAYTDWDWYKIPKKTEKATWSEPYYDEGGGEILMCTYSVPFFKKDPGADRALFQGVVTADISLEWLTNLIGNACEDVHSGYGFLISSTGKIISFPEEDHILKKDIFTLARETGSKELDMLGRKMTGGHKGVDQLTCLFSDKKCYFAYSKIPETNWSLAVVFQEEELLKALHDLNKRAGMIAVAGVLLMFAVIILISRSITEPIKTVVAAAGRVADGDLDIKLDAISGKDEVGMLAAAFTKMAGDLNHYINELTKTTAAKERIESELNIASQIQKSILPSIFPPFPDRKEFELFAFMQPARQVGGDYYDFFMVDENRLAIVIADVSDKGVPAALFMMVSRTLINSIASRDKSPAEVLEEANNILCQGNDAAMFVTVFLGFYEISTGKLVYANGGHNPSMIVNSAREVRLFGSRTGAALGFMEDALFNNGEDQMDVSDILVLYTDGVTEAMTPEHEMFGEERLCEFLSERSDKSLIGICEDIEKELDEFQQGNQFDDITIMMLRRKS